MSTNTVICPQCKTSIPLDEVFRRQADDVAQKRLADQEARIAATFREQFEKERKELLTKQEAEKKELEEKIRTRILRQQETAVKTLQDENTEMRALYKKTQDELISQAKRTRELAEERDQIRISFEKKLLNVQETIRQETRKLAQEEYILKIKEKDQKLEAVMRMNDELKRKLELGSQQAQGEALELALEEVLEREFPLDRIEEVPKGVRGADLLQRVRARSAKECGIILWETKRTKNWNQEWISKLKEDQRVVRAELAVIVTETLPADITHIGLVNGIWVCDFGSVVGLAYALRSRLLEVFAVRTSQEGKEEKMEVLYQYLSGTDFRMRVEAIVEAFRALEDDIKKERSWFMAKWARQEKNITRVIDNTFGMQGDLQSIMGPALPVVAGVQLPEGEVAEEEEPPLFS